MLHHARMAGLGKPQRGTDASYGRRLWAESACQFNAESARVTQPEGARTRHSPRGSRAAGLGSTAIRCTAHELVRCGQICLSPAQQNSPPHNGRIIEPVAPMRHDISKPMVHRMPHGQIPFRRFTVPVPGISHADQAGV